MAQGGAIKPPTKNTMSRKWPPAAASDGGANAFRLCSRQFSTTLMRLNMAEHVDGLSCYDDYVDMKRQQ